MHPSSGITKEYSVTLDRRPRQEDLQAIAEGGCCCCGEGALGGGAAWGLGWAAGRVRGLVHRMGG